MNFIKRFLSYLLEKKSEAKHLGYKDALLANLIAKVHTKKKSERTMQVLLYDILPIHIIDRENALKKVKERAKILKKNKSKLLGKSLTQNTLKNYLPSISNFKVLPHKGKFVAIEGNGRLEALKQVFSKEDAMQIEVDVIEVLGLEKDIERVRSLNFQ